MFAAKDFIAAALVGRLGNKRNFFPTFIVLAMHPNFAAIYFPKTGNCLRIFLPDAFVYCIEVLSTPPH
jgi:hypothetical protein